MHPTPRAVLLFALAVALAVPWALLAGDWWQIGVALPLTALLALGVDAGAGAAPHPPQRRGQRAGDDGDRPAGAAHRLGRRRPQIGGGRCAVLPEVSGPLQPPAATEIDWTGARVRVGAAVAEWLLQARAPRHRPAGARVAALDRARSA